MNWRDHAELDLAMLGALRPHAITPATRAEILSTIGLEIPAPLPGRLATKEAQAKDRAVDAAFRRLSKQGLVQYRKGEGWLFVVPRSLQQRHAP